jgi:hypothetical protein
MKKHTEIGLNAIDPDTMFDFHGLRIRAERSENMGCTGCFFNTRMKDLLGRDMGGHDCDKESLPLCEQRKFVEDGFNNEDEFKVWLVIKRMGLDDET